MEEKDQYQVNQLRAHLEKEDPNYDPDRFNDQYYLNLIELSREISPETISIIQKALHKMT